MRIVYQMTPTQPRNVVIRTMAQTTDILTTVIFCIRICRQCSCRLMDFTNVNMLWHRNEKTTVPLDLSLLFRRAIVTLGSLPQCQCQQGALIKRLPDHWIICHTFIRYLLEQKNIKNPSVYRLRRFAGGNMKRDSCIATRHSLTVRYGAVRYTLSKPYCHTASPACPMFPPLPLSIFLGTLPSFSSGLFLSFYRASP